MDAPHFLHSINSWNCIHCCNISLDEVGILRFVCDGGHGFDHQSLLQCLADRSIFGFAGATHFVCVATARWREQSVVGVTMTKTRTRSGWQAASSSSTTPLNHLEFAAAITKTLGRKIKTPLAKPLEERTNSNRSCRLIPVGGRNWARIAHRSSLPSAYGSGGGNRYGRWS